MMALTEQVLVSGFSKNTANGEGLTGPNTHGFSLMKFFAGILSRFLGQQCILLNNN